MLAIAGFILTQSFAVEESASDSENFPLVIKITNLEMVAWHMFREVVEKIGQIQ